VGLKGAIRGRRGEEKRRQLTQMRLVLRRKKKKEKGIPSSPSGSLGWRGGERGEITFSLTSSDIPTKGRIVAT